MDLLQNIFPADNFTLVAIILGLPAIGAFVNGVFGKRLGKKRMAAMARFLERQAAGFGGSISLGFFLGMTPVFAKFFGLPLDVRHITLSTGSLTLSIQSVGVDHLGWAPVIWACVGIAFIGMMNFGVSRPSLPQVIFSLGTAPE